MKNFQDEAHIRILSCLFGGHTTMFYCLSRDITAPAHLVMMLVDIRCGSEGKKNTIGQIIL